MNAVICGIYTVLYYIVQLLEVAFYFLPFSPFSFAPVITMFHFWDFRLILKIPFFSYFCKIVILWLIKKYLKKRVCGIILCENP